MGYYSITCTILLTNYCTFKVKKISTTPQQYGIYCSVLHVQPQATYLIVLFLKVSPSPSHISQPFVARILELPSLGRWECTRGQVPVWMTSMSSTWPKPPSLHWDSWRSPAFSHAPVITSCRSPSKSFLYLKAQWIHRKCRIWSLSKGNLIKRRKFVARKCRDWNNFLHFID